MTKCRGEAASYAPNIAEIVTRIAALALATGLVASSATAADRYWDPNGTSANRGGTGNWDLTSPFWSPSGDGVSGPYSTWNNSAVDNAFFGGAGSTVTLTSPITVDSLTFDGPGYTLTGGTLNLAGATPTITTIGGTIGASIESIITGTSGLTKGGAGTLGLYGANSFTGDVFLNAGTLILNGDAALGAASNRIVTSDGTFLSSTGALAASRVVSLGSGLTDLSGAGVGSARFTGSGGIIARDGVSLTNDVILADGRFYLAGIHYLDTPGLGIFGVACVGIDGTPCADFGDGGTTTIALNEPGFNSGATRILYRDGKLYVIGNTDPGGDNGHSSAIAIAKLDATTGALDPTFGDGSGPLPGSEIFDPQRYPDGYDFANAAAFASNGDVLVGGSAQNNDGQGSDGFVLALDPSSGAADTAFGDGGYAWFSFDTGVHFDGVSVRAIQVRDDGRILIAGDANHDDEFFNTITGVLLASLQADGSPSADFGANGVNKIDLGQNTEVLDLAVRAGGELVVSMASNGILPNEYTSDMLQSIAQFNASGIGPTSTVSIEYPSQVTPGGRPTSMLVDARDRILVAGFRLWDFNFPVPDSDHVITRLVRDVIFSDGFES